MLETRSQKLGRGQRIVHDQAGKPEVQNTVREEQKSTCKRTSRAQPTAGMNLIRKTGCGEHTAGIFVQEGSQPSYAAGRNEGPGQGPEQGPGRETSAGDASRIRGRHTVALFHSA